MSDGPIKTEKLYANVMFKYERVVDYNECFALYNQSPLVVLLHVGNKPSVICTAGSSAAQASKVTRLVSACIMWIL